jgi:hypothetical protein
VSEEEEWSIFEDTVPVPLLYENEEGPDIALDEPEMHSQMQAQEDASVSEEKVCVRVSCMSVRDRAVCVYMSGGRGCG